MNKIRKEKLKYIYPMFATLIIYCTILCVKHIFPFGKNTIDYYDMAQQITPFYYHVHDMLHGKTAFFFTFYSALGTNMTMSTSGCSNFSLFNLFFLFVPRQYILESLSVFHLIKLLVMTFTMFFYLDRSFRTPYFFKLFLSVDYAFCGFVLMLYMTNQWVDIAALFPLVMYFYDKMMRGGRITGYVISLALVLINSYYLGLMILLYIFLYTGLKMWADRLYKPKEKRGRVYILELAFATILGITLSLFIVIPQLTQTLSSARFSNGSAADGSVIGLYTEILKQTTPAYTTRWWSLLNLSFAAAVICIGLLRLWNKKRLRFMAIGMIILMVSELFLESINLIWHFGSYVQYPIRNGFIINFTFAVLASMYAERLFQENFESVSFLGLLVTILLFTIFVLLYNRHPGMQVRSVFHITAAMMLVSFAGYFILLFWKKGAHYSLTLMILCTELLCYGFLLYGKPAFITGYTEEPEQDGEFIRITRQLKKEFDLSDEFLYRMKNPDETLNANYSFIMGRPALSNWTHLISPDLQKSASEWGYSIQFTRLLDAGGTAFTDALIGVRDVISCVPQDEELYEKVASADIVIDHLTGETMEYTYYKCRYALPFGVPVYANAMFDAELENRNIVSLQNQMYRSLTGADTEYEQEIAAFKVRNGQLMDEESGLSVSAVSPNVKRYLIDDKVIGKKALYFHSATSDLEDRNMTITVIGNDVQKAVSIPSIKDPFNTAYPAHFNNNVIYLGSYEDETVSIVIDVDTEKGKDYPVNISELDLNKLKILCDSYSDHMNEHITADKKGIAFQAEVSEAAGDSVMLLPLAYDDGWSLKVNGKKSDILYAYSGLFTAIPLYSGVNSYEMRYFPPDMGLGIVISAVGLMVFVALLIIRLQKIKMIEDELVTISRDFEGWLVPAYLVLWAVAVLLIYIIPLGAAVIL